MSTVYSRERFTWNKDKLYLGEEFLIEVIPYEIKGMFKLRWADGTESKDFYNYSHARENAIRTIQTAYNGIEEPEWKAEDIDEDRH